MSCSRATSSRPLQDSAVGVTFSDGTTFSLSANARMVLNEFVYSANGSANSAVINLVQGSFIFVAGKVAHTGDMKVGTPIGIMGIRGTAVNVTIKADNGAADIFVMAEGDGLTHAVRSGRSRRRRISRRAGLSALCSAPSPVSAAYFPFTPTPTGILVQETGKDAATIRPSWRSFRAVFRTQSVGEAILAQRPAPNSAGNQPGTQIPTTTFPTELSTTEVVVTTTTTSDGTTVTSVQTVPPPEGSPPTVPLDPTVPDQTNHSPAVAHQIADQSSPEDQAWSFQVPSNTFSDPDNNALTLTATLADGSPLPAWLTSIQ